MSKGGRPATPRDIVALKDSKKLIREILALAEVRKRKRLEYYGGNEPGQGGVKTEGLKVFGDVSEEDLKVVRTDFPTVQVMKQMAREYHFGDNDAKSKLTLLQTICKMVVDTEKEFAAWEKHMTQTLFEAAKLELAQIKAGGDKTDEEFEAEVQAAEAWIQSRAKSGA